MFGPVIIWNMSSPVVTAAVDNTEGLSSSHLELD